MKFPEIEDSRSKGFDGLEPTASGNWGLGYEQSLHLKPPIEKEAKEKTSKVASPSNYFVRPSSLSPQQLEEANEAWKAKELKSIYGPSSTSAACIDIPWEVTNLRVYGRDFTIHRHISGVTKWTFDELCCTNLGPADYISLASTFHTLILTDVPILTLLRKNEARRFIVLLDALYEARCKLLIHAEAGPDEIFFPETKVTLKSDASRTSDDGDDGVYSETFAEIYQEQISPFRPNISSYSASASPPSYTSGLHASSSNPSAVRSVLADEDSDFGPVYGAGRSHGPSDGAPGAGNEIGRQFGPDFRRTGIFTGEDERFAYKRARSRLWEMCGSRWWTREEEGWWRPVGKDVRRWEGTSQMTNSRMNSELPISGRKEESAEELFRHGASPFRTSQEPPPKFGWQHAWGMITWGRKAGAWYVHHRDHNSVICQYSYIFPHVAKLTHYLRRGKGPEGLNERRGKS